MITVSEVMSTDVKTLQTSASVYDAKKIMAENNIRHIPILTGNELVGIVSQRDVLRADVSSVIKHVAVDLTKQSITEIMSKNIHSVVANDSLRAAGLMMQRYKYGCLPVVENDRLIGIITDSDLVAAAINMIEQYDEFEDMSAMTS